MAVKRNKWSAADLKEAVIEIQKGLSLRGAARKFNIPRGSLQRRLKQQNFSQPKSGKKCVFNKEQEEMLVQQMMVLLNSNDKESLSAMQVRAIAYQWAEKLQLSHNFNRDKKLAGKDWLYKFLHRHPEILVKKTKANETEDKDLRDDELLIMTMYAFQSHSIFGTSDISV